jgi:NAD(P)-dependent dehydrogenase (short-subunit alcohol dehydrogenase family)
LSGRIEGKIAIVAGAGSCGPGWGNGKAAAVLFAREGARVLAVDINPAAAEETRSIIEREGGFCVCEQADVSVSGHVEKVVARCIQEFGRIDILHNNVGILKTGGPVELSEEDWDRVFAVNVKAMFLMCKHVLPVMEAQRAGAIVNVSSVASIRFTGSQSVAYNASKGAVNQLTQNVAVQYAAKGIRVNCILPGVIDTPMITAPLKAIHGSDAIDEVKRKRAAAVPMRRLGTAWDVAYAALFLSSEESRYITGAQLVVDGGLTCVA